MILDKEKNVLTNEDDEALDEEDLNEDDDLLEDEDENDEDFVDFEDEE